MLKIVYYYPFEKEVQDAMPFEKAKSRNVPVGAGHIFELKYDGEIQDRSMCGKAMSDISEKTTKRTTRIESLPLCVKCINVWKSHPESEYQKWIGNLMDVQNETRR